MHEHQKQSSSLSSSLSCDEQLKARKRIITKKRNDMHKALYTFVKNYSETMEWLNLPRDLREKIEQILQFQ